MNEKKMMNMKQRNMKKKLEKTVYVFNSVMTSQTTVMHATDSVTIF